MRHSINIGCIKPRIPNLGAFFNNPEGPLRIAVIYPCRWSRSRFWGGMCTVNRYCGCFKHGVQRSRVELYNLKSKICEWVWWDIVVKDSRQKKKKRWRKSTMMMQWIIEFEKSQIVIIPWSKSRASCLKTQGHFCIIHQGALSRPPCLLHHFSCGNLLSRRWIKCSPIQVSNSDFFGIGSILNAYHSTKASVCSREVLLTLVVDALMLSTSDKC